MFVSIGHISIKMANQYLHAAFSKCKLIVPTLFVLSFISIIIFFYFPTGIVFGCLPLAIVSSSIAMLIESGIIGCCLNILYWGKRILVISDRSMFRVVSFTFGANTDDATVSFGVEEEDFPLLQDTIQRNPTKREHTIPEILNLFEHSLMIYPIILSFKRLDTRSRYINWRRWLP